MLIPSGHRRECEKCHAIGSFTVAINADAFTLECGCCHNKTQYSEANPFVICKVASDRVAVFEWGYEIHRDAAPHEKPDVSHDTPCSGAEDGGFVEVLRQIPAKTLSIFNDIDYLQSGLAELKSALTWDVGHHYSRMAGLMDDIDEGAIGRFVENPIASLCVDSERGDYILLAPQFYKRPLGISLPCTGEFVPYYTTPEIRSHLPLPTWLYGDLGIAPPARICVRDNRIVGLDADRVCREIRGVEIDRSVSNGQEWRIISSYHARTDLLRYGCSPWSSCRIHGDGLFHEATISYHRMLENKLYQEMLDFTLERKRSVLIGESTAMRTFAGLFSASSKASCLVLTADPARWAEMNLGARYYDVERGFPRYVIVDHHFVIADVDAEFPLEILQSLHEFQGGLVVLLHEPLGSCLELTETSVACMSLASGMREFYQRKKKADAKWCIPSAVLSEFAKLRKP